MEPLVAAARRAQQTIEPHSVCARAGEPIGVAMTEGRGGLVKMVKW